MTPYRTPAVIPPEHRSLYQRAKAQCTYDRFVALAASFNACVSVRAMLLDERPWAQVLYALATLCWIWFGVRYWRKSR